MNTKKCKCCNRELELNNFPNDKSKKGGKKSICIECVNLKRKINKQDYLEGKIQLKPTYTCTKCKLEKANTEFNTTFRGKGKSIVTSTCKDCISIYGKSKAAKNKPANITHKLCNQCLVVKIIKEFSEDKWKSDGYRTICKNCSNSNKRKYKDNLLNISALLPPTSTCKICNQTKETKKFRLDYTSTAITTHTCKQCYNKQRAEYAKTPQGKFVMAKKKFVRRIREMGGTVDKDKMITFEQWQEILSNQNNKCNFCKCEFTDELVASIDHIVSIKKGGDSQKENIQALCVSCNSSKGKKDNEEYKNDINRVRALLNLEPL